MVPSAHLIPASVPQTGRGVDSNAETCARSPSWSNNPRANDVSMLMHGALNSVDISRQANNLRVSSLFQARTSLNHERHVRW